MRRPPGRGEYGREFTSAWVLDAKDSKLSVRYGRKVRRQEPDQLANLVYQTKRRNQRDILTYN
jgi:hypothetical protein